MHKLLSYVPIIGSYFCDINISTNFTKFKNSLYFNIFVLKESEICTDIIKLIINNYFELFNPTLHFNINKFPKIILDGTIYDELSCDNYFSGDISNIIDVNYTKYYKICLTRSGNLFMNTFSSTIYSKINLSGIIKIISGTYETLCLSENGIVYAITKYMIYKTNLENIAKISMICDYFMVLTSLGDIYKIYFIEIHTEANELAKNNAIYNNISYRYSGSDGCGNKYDICSKKGIFKKYSMYNKKINRKYQKKLILSHQIPLQFFEIIKLNDLSESEIIIDLVCLSFYNVFLSNLGNVYVHYREPFSSKKISDLPFITNINGSGVDIMFLDKNHNAWYFEGSYPVKKIDLLPNIIQINCTSMHNQYLLMDSSLDIYCVNIVDNSFQKLEF